MDGLNKLFPLPSRCQSSLCISDLTWSWSNRKREQTSSEQTPHLPGLRWLLSSALFKTIGGCDLHSLWPSKGTVGSLIPFGGRLHEIAETGREIARNCTYHSKHACACTSMGARRPALLSGGREMARSGRGRDTGVGFCRRDAPERRGACDVGMLEMIALHQRGVKLSRRRRSEMPGSIFFWGRELERKVEHGQMGFDCLNL